MRTQLTQGMLALLLTLSLAACQSNSDDVREAARQNLEQGVQPANPNASAAQPASPNTPSAPAGPTTTVEFEEERFDFGTVTEGEEVSHVFKFKNTGQEPLILSDARGSCGCTVPQWPREPIAPGDEAEIKVVFNSRNKVGKRSQKVTITANTEPPQKFIYLEGQVQPAEGNAEAPVN